MVLECAIDALYGLRGGEREREKTPINVGFLTCVAYLRVTCIGIIFILKIVWKKACRGVL